MEEQKKYITIATFQYSVVVKGIERKLKESGYEVEVITEILGKIQEYALRSDLIVLYLPNDLMDKAESIEGMKYICGKVQAAAAKMLLIGEPKYHEDVISSVPESSVYPWLDRPINMEEFIPQIEEAIKSEIKPYVKKRILIVDDDPSYAKMVREWIKEDYRVDIVTAGMQAITFLLKVKEDEKVDLILLDYEMPVVDGPQVLQMLRQEPVTEKIPIIFLTGNGSKEAVSRVMALKPDGYILKSTSRYDLMTYLRGKLK